MAEKKTQKQIAKEEGGVKKETASDDKSSDKSGSDKKEVDDKTKDSNGVNILSFYGKEAKAEDEVDEEGKNWGSILSERRINAAKAAALKEKMERERAEQREKEYQVFI